MNVEDWEAAALHEIVARIERRRRRARGAEVAGSELVGLMPAGAAAAAAGAVLRIDGFDAVARARAAPAGRRVIGTHSAQVVHDAYGFRRYRRTWRGGRWPGGSDMAAG